MTTLSATYLDKTKYKSMDFRAFFADFIGNGLYSLSHFPISYPSPASMQVIVGSNSINSVAMCGYGFRISDNMTPTTLTFNAADPTNPRIDIIQIGINATTDSNNDTTGTPVLQIKQGVAAASPIEPGADPGFVKLYAVNIAVNQITITASNVTDRRSLVPFNLDGSQISNISGVQQSAFQSFLSDLFGSTSVVISGGIATKDGTDAKQMDVTAADVYFGTGQHVNFPASNNGQFITSTASTTYYLDYNSDGTTSWGTSHSTKTGYVTICSVTTDASGNILTVTDARPLTANLLGSSPVNVNLAPSSVKSSMLSAAPNFGFPNRLRPSIANFVRNSVAWRKNFSQVVANQLRTEMGAMGDAPYIEEGTTNLPVNTGFETVTGTATVFSDALTSYTGSTVPAPWTNVTGSWTFGASGSTSGANGSFMTAGNANWKPVIGSNGASLSQTVQATFTTPSTVPKNFEVQLRVDSNNLYRFAWQADNNLCLYKVVGGGTQVSLANTTGSTQTASHTYTMTLSIDPSGNLTAKLYDGATTGGTLLQTLTKQDTSLTGGFLIGVGGDTGVIIKSAQVTAPFADGWTISGDSRVAWALTSQAIAGNYSVNAVGVASGVFGTCYPTTNITVSANTTYTFSIYANSQNEGNTNEAKVQVDWYNGATNIGTQAFAWMAGNVLTQRFTGTYTSPVNTNQVKISLVQGDSGTVTFDCIQLEQKAYATSYIPNDATSGTATRNADSLSFTLAQPLPSKWFGAARWIPDQASNVPTGNGVAKVLLWTMSKSNSRRHWVQYNTTAGTFRFGKDTGSSTAFCDSSVISFNAGDTITIFFEDDPTNTGYMYLWVGVNGGTLQQFTLANTWQFSDAQIIFDGSDNTPTSFANGTVEPLITDKIPTTEQINWLYNAPKWGDGNFPDVFQPNTGWFAPTLLNGWVNNGGANPNVQIMKDPNGFVHIRGLIKGGTTTSSTALFNLPTGFRPSVGIIRSSVSTYNGTSVGTTNIAVNPSGAVTIDTSNAYGNTWLDLSGIPPFLAEQ